MSPAGCPSGFVPALLCCAGADTVCSTVTHTVLGLSAMAAPVNYWPLHLLYRTAPVGRKEERGRAHSKHSVGGLGCPTSHCRWALLQSKTQQSDILPLYFFFSCFRRLEIPYVVQNKVRLGIDRNNSKLMSQKSIAYSQAMITKSVKRSWNDSMKN